jgi:ATP-dependent DNA ligase
MIDRSQMKSYPGGYMTGSAAAFEDESLLHEVRRRRRQHGQMTVPLDIESAKRRIPDARYQISRKIDGEFTCLVYRKGEAFTLNPGGTLRLGAPFMLEATAILKKAKVKSALIGGELYVQRDDGERPRVHDVVRVARNPADEAEIAQLAFGAFDIYELDGEDLALNHDSVLARLRELFTADGRVHPVETVEGENAAAVIKQFKAWVIDEDAEGVVARSEKAGVFKVKPRHSLDLAVIGFSEGLDDRAGLLHDMLLAVVRPSGRFQLTCRVGGGLSDELRASLLQQLSQRVVESDFREVNTEHVAYQMVEPGLVVEIECLDIISRTSRGNPIDKMVLAWNADNKRWEGVRRLPLCSILSPQFVRLRDDKHANADDVRLDQLASIRDIPDIERVAAEQALPASAVLHRVVACKTMREALMVRKIIAIKTNKAEASKDFPAFVLHVTDFSPNRKEKLQMDVKVTEDPEQIESLFEAAKKEYFKKGWQVQP